MLLCARRLLCALAIPVAAAIAFAPQALHAQQPPPPPPPPSQPAPPPPTPPNAPLPPAPTGSSVINAAPAGTTAAATAAASLPTPPAATKKPPPPQEQPTPPAAGPTGAGKATPAPKAMAKPKAPPFIKGDLIHPGTRRLLSRFDHVGVAVGPLVLGNDIYLSVTPGFAWYFKKVAVSAGVPLNLLMFQGGNLSFGGMKIRRQDWDEVPDYAKIIRFFTIGRKEDHLYFTINSLRPATIGHGMLMHDYQANIDIDRSMTGLIFDAYDQYAGFQFQANDITFTNRVIGGLVFVKPLSLFTKNVLAQSLSLGAEYVGDLRAPRCVKLSKDSSTCVKGSGQAAGVDPFTGQSLDHTFVRTDPTTGRFDVKETTAQAAGFSGEFKFLKDARNVDMKVYGTYHQFLNPGGGNGWSVGLLGRFNAGLRWISAFRVKGEFRNFGDGFLPNYFDSLYEIQKYSYRLAKNPYQVTPTKYQAVFGDPKNGFPRQHLGRRNGFDLEASWGLFKGSRGNKKVALGFGLQDSTGPDDTQFYAHIEFPLLGFLQVFATYMKVNEQSIAKIFANNPFNANNAVVLTGLRLEILPFLFVNANYSRSYRIVRSPGSEYHLGNSSVVDANGNPSPYFKHDTLFENVQTLYVELEVGWEFDNSSSTGKEY